MKITKKERRSLIEALKKKVPDFSLKVAHIYKLLEWRWATGKNDELLIPSVLEIRKALYRMIESMEEHKSIHWSAGGLEIEFEKNEDKSIAGYLRFQLEEYCIPEEDK